MKMFSSKFIEQLEPINFWEPFGQKASWPKVGLRGIIAELRKINRAKIPTESIHFPVFSKPILLSANTLNQREALRPLIEHFADRLEIITERPDLFTEFKSDIVIHYTPTNQELASLAIRSAAGFIWAFFSFRGYIRDAYLRRFYNLFKVIGQYHFLKICFEKSPQVKLYIASNDHSGLSQVGFVTAEESARTTLYLQHASVTQKFPPLRTSYALLEGRDAMEKYAAAGHSKTEIHLVGTMKYDRFLAASQNLPLPDLVGIAIGSVFNNYLELLKLCQLLENANQTACLRFHPAVSAEIKDLFRTLNWPESKPENETALAFILRCKTVISGDSNILLETLIMRRRPIYFASEGIVYDYYGFLKNGLLEGAFQTSSDVMDALDRTYNLLDFRAKAEYYIAFLQSPEAANSANRVIDHVERVLN